VKLWRELASIAAKRRIGARYGRHVPARMDRSVFEHYGRGLVTTSCVASGRLGSRAAKAYRDLPTTNYASAVLPTNYARGFSLSSQARLVTIAQMLR
jgi:hypothetical protein